MKKSKIEEFVDNFLDDNNSFEDLLEYLDITNYDAIEVLFDEGLIDEDLIDRYLGYDT